MNNYIITKINEFSVSDIFYTEIEFVCHNSDYDDSSNKNSQKELYNDLKIMQSETDYEIFPYMQDFSDEAHTELSLAVIILNNDNYDKLKNDILKLARKNNIKIDLYNKKTNKQVDYILRNINY